MLTGVMIGSWPTSGRDCAPSGGNGRHAYGGRGSGGGDVLSGGYGADQIKAGEGPATGWMRAAESTSCGSARE